MGSTARILLGFGAAMLAGCASHLPTEFNEQYYNGGKLTEGELAGGYVNTPFMRYMDQRDAEARVAREIADEFERRSVE